jgi:hypothetical protein
MPYLASLEILETPESQVPFKVQVNAYARCDDRYREKRC